MFPTYLQWLGAARALLCDCACGATADPHLYTSARVPTEAAIDKNVKNTCFACRPWGSKTTQITCQSGPQGAKFGPTRKICLPIPTKGFIRAYLPPSPHASEGHQYMHIASESEPQCAKFAPARLNHPPIPMDSWIEALYPLRRGWRSHMYLMPLNNASMTSPI